MIFTFSTVLTWLSMSVRLATPLLLTALGGMIAQKAGILNFALEGMMLAGAFFGYIGAVLSGNPWVGLFYAIIVGSIAGAVLAFTSIKLAVSQLVVGLGINIFFLGLTGYLSRLFDRTGSELAVATMFTARPIPLLSSIPILGNLLFNHNILVYTAIILVVLIHWFFSRTTWGLSLRSVGENPAAADTVGINVFAVRYAATICSGILASMGGAFLTLTQVSRFLENMVQGRGWIALAAVIFGKWKPFGVLAACLLFGAADAFQMQMQIIGVRIPYQVALMTPYILTILALTGLVGKGRSPAASGKPYVR